MLIKINNNNVFTKHGDIDTYNEVLKILGKDNMSKSYSHILNKYDILKRSEFLEVKSKYYLTEYSYYISISKVGNMDFITLAIFRYNDLYSTLFFSDRNKFKAEINKALEISAIKLDKHNYNTYEEYFKQVSDNKSKYHILQESTEGITIVRHMNINNRLFISIETVSSDIKNCNDILIEDNIMTSILERL